MKFGIIGDGNAGRLHKEAIKGLSGEHTIITVDTKYGSNISHLDDFPERLKECDYISVCVPHGFHVHVAEVVRANCKAKILLEKPVGVTEEQINILEKIPEVYPVFQNRFSPLLNKFERLFSSIIGEQKCSVYVTVNMPRDEEYYSGWRGDPIHCEHVLTNQAIHYFDYVIQLCGGLSNLNAFAVRFNDRKDYEAMLEMGNKKITFRCTTKCNAKNLWINCIVNDWAELTLSDTTIMGRKVFEQMEDIHNQYGSYTGSGRYHKEFIEGVIAGSSKLPSIQYACDLMRLCLKMVK